MSCEETAPVGCIWLHFGASVIKGAQRVKPRAAIYHAGYVLHHLSRAELSSSGFFEHWLASCGSPVCWLPVLVLMSHTCAWLFNHSFSGFCFFLMLQWKLFSSTRTTRRFHVVSRCSSASCCTNTPWSESAEQQEQHRCDTTDTIRARLWACTAGLAAFML